MPQFRAYALALASALVLLGTTTLAQTVEPGQPCMGCHKPRDTMIDPDRYARSVHASLDCTACHADGFGKFPHEAKRADAPDCMTCHAGVATPPYDFVHIEQGVQQSVHAKMAGGEFRCTNCHSPHYFVPATRMTDAPAAVRIANEPCLHCHAEGDTTGGGRPSVTKLAKQHQWLPHWELHLSGAPCIACHTAREQRAGATNAALEAQRTAHVVLPKEQALRDCAGCHSKNSVLMTKLYDYLAWQERAERGWLNAVLFNNAYLVGATRNWWLDWATMALTAMTVLGVAIHGAGRWLAARSRRKS
ncbi:MAG TPA: hypothetical protein VMW56_22515 [Candidatus Margulisiibacteriota bacterium]|nr:hypothetical protein [Candidatus Margulisiibacteriota bacterium]